MNGWIWQLRQWARKLGIAGIVGLAALTAAIVIQLGVVASLHETAQSQQARLQQLRLSNAPVAPPPAPLNPLAGLPPTGEASQLIGELEQLAQAHGMTLPRGQYSVAPVATAAMQHWRLVLPLETTYPTLHAFLAAALERLPNLSLDELKVKRDRIESEQLQVELRLSLFVESTP
ncbi:MAG: hypothetical protein IV085_05585 [Thiobacillus sp.]|nr:hypothetical protein [Thiobacillus sp.]